MWGRAGDQSIDSNAPTTSLPLLLLCIFSSGTSSMPVSAHPVRRPSPPPPPSPPSTPFFRADVPAPTRRAAHRVRQMPAQAHADADEALPPPFGAVVKLSALRLELATLRDLSLGRRRRRSCLARSATTIEH